MKIAKMLTIVVLSMGLMVCLPRVSKAAPMGTAFTYQGRLIDANSPADGLYEFEFKLYDSPTDGNQLDGTVAFRGVDVIDGYFTVELDFGSSVFTGDARWLEIGIRPSDTPDPFTPLAPRQEVTPTPYAIYAENASTDNDWMVSGSDMYSILSGNVGIGTSSPDTRLHISGAGAQRLHLESTSAAGIAFIQTSNADRTWQFGTASSEPFIIQDLTAGPVRMVIDTTGNVGIGTTNPNDKLEVNGAISTGNGGLRWKTFSGTFDGNQTIEFAHGLDASKIIHASCSFLMPGTTPIYINIPDQWGGTGVYWDNTFMKIWDDWGGGGGLVGQPYRCVVMYVM